MKKILLISMITFLSCDSMEIHNKDTNPVPVTIIKGDTQKDSSQANADNSFRAMGAGENEYIVKALGDPAIIVQYLFVSAKPFSPGDVHEIDILIKSNNGVAIFQTPLPLTNEGFSQIVQFKIRQDESLTLQSTTDRFTFLASGNKLK